LVQFGHSIPQKSREADYIILELRQTTHFDSLKIAFGNDEAALPVIAPIKQHEQLAVLKKAERLLRVVLFFRNSHPENIDRYTKLASLEAGARLNDGMASIRTNDEIRTHIQL